MLDGLEWEENVLALSLKERSTDAEGMRDDAGDFQVSGSPLELFNFNLPPSTVLSASSSSCIRISLHPLEMALIQTSLIWVVYAIALVLTLGIASIFVIVYQAPRERSIAVTVVCIFTLLSLLATALLLPVDVALVSSTTSSKQGKRKHWATQDEVDSIVKTLEIVYYFLYSLDAILCLVVLPFTYFWHEEYDEVDADEGNQTFGQRFWGAFKYTIAFILLVVILFIIGFFVPVAKDRKGAHYDLEYFKHLLHGEGHGERALTFALGLLITIGTLIYILYTAAGFALLPITFIKSAPGVSAPTLSANTASELEQNRERQRQLEMRNEGQEGGLPAKDRRELEALVREERTLVRRERLASEASGEGQGWLIKTWIKIEAAFRPVKLLGGILMMVLAIFVWICMILTFADKAKNSTCKSHCGYVLGHINIFNPINYIFVQAAKVFPIDYIIYLLLVLYFFSSSVVGIGVIGIRFLWLEIFKIRKGHTTPQAMLLATMLMSLMVLAIFYSMAMIVAPQYTHYGPQTFCDREIVPGDGQPDCSTHHNAIKPCTERSTSLAAARVCTPSVASTFIDRITVNFSFFGAVDFWAQIAFFAVFLIVLVTSLVRTPKLDQYQLDQDAEEDEEEGLLASTGRRFGATWQDLTGRAKKPTNNAGQEGRHDDDENE
ncbi:uncharacterized protein KY384_008544 [Bacidia gigantensis]|uniref:uncharacterized protein n=1 Tax=Bacidia gigantensis TaxID=2732470 RepID=UPI001D03F0EE|nr:uncharacterized protein KY384_008544 [Bacidia gigantensis]KAG8527115.1 hypothetical protein KY384_008544 [Bacidia gigantensis]